MTYYIDTHCHLDFNAFDNDREQIISRAYTANVTRIINPAIDVESSRAIIELSKRYSQVFGAVGVHPNSAGLWNASTSVVLSELAHDVRICAVGEIGLDYYWDRTPKKVQREAFCKQLDLAEQAEKPVIVHNREATADVLAILKDWKAHLVSRGLVLANTPGVLHSFSGNLKDAREAVEMNFMLGITGPVTFKKAIDLQEIVSEVPLEHILIETDAPFLTPNPFRGKRNEPAYVIHVAEKIAVLRDISVDVVARSTSRNAERLFGWRVTD